MLKQELQQKQALSPQHVIEATLLQINNSNLEKIILEELEKNPILEPVDTVEEVQNSTDSEDVDNEDWDDDYEPANIYEPKREKKNFPLQDQKNFFEKIKIFSCNIFNIFFNFINLSILSNIFSFMK